MTTMWMWWGGEVWESGGGWRVGGKGVEVSLRVGVVECGTAGRGKVIEVNIVFRSDTNACIAGYDRVIEWNSYTRHVKRLAYLQSVPRNYRKKCPSKPEKSCRK